MRTVLRALRFLREGYHGVTTGGWRAKAEDVIARIESGELKIIRVEKGTTE
ncbi:hypothetical protein [Bradyrhizobium jicamae]|uniref:hypothetical protein n=1 Tax=Bradyrhizobium jicamae TaxID=280332 RepID=UPI001BAA2F68|nr:hypothetical protein [Bradyrhizobium jicamae]MBR0936993.1 hypothetical protein [Bradyrhizobium jicamae]